MWETNNRATVAEYRLLVLIFIVVLIVGWFSVFDVRGDFLFSGWSHGM
jgi:hypothetical protein